MKQTVEVRTIHRNRGYMTQDGPLVYELEWGETVISARTYWSLNDTRENLEIILLVADPSAARA